MNETQRLYEKETIIESKRDKIVENEEHLNYSDSELEEAHEYLGISGKPYLMLESELNKLSEDGINPANYITQTDTSFFAPSAVMNLLMNNRYGQVYVKLGKSSNIQEIAPVYLSRGQVGDIKIGCGSSLAHAVKFSFPQGKRIVKCRIGDNVFVGIGTEISDIRVGDHCSIGFNCSIKSGAKVGKYSTICDGAEIEEDVEIPDFSVVPPGMKVTKKIANKSGLSPEEYSEQTQNGIRNVKRIIRFTENQKSRILEAEEWQKRGGNDMANKILEDCGVDASSLFLTKFNQIVVSENRYFPIMYRLMERFHADQIELSDKSTQSKKYGKNVLIMNLPRNRTEFIRHYMSQVKAKVPLEQIKAYIGEFTKTEIDWDNVSFEGNTHIIGKAKIYGKKCEGRKEGKVVIGQNFVIRGDEMEPNAEVIIENCTLGENITIHASGDKVLKNVNAGNNCVFHGAEDLQNCSIGNVQLLNVVKASDCRLHGNSIILGTELSDCSIGERATVIGHSVKGNGHNGKIKLRGVNAGKGVVISFNSTLESSNDGRIWIGKDTIIAQSTEIVGSGQIGASCVIGPHVELRLMEDIKDKRVVLFGGRVIRKKDLLKLVAAKESINSTLRSVKNLEIRKRLDAVAMALSAPLNCEDVENDDQ